MSCSLAFLVIVTIAGILSSADAICDCPIFFHPEGLPKNSGCKGEFISIVNVTGSVTEGSTIRYSVKILADFTSQLADHRNIFNFDHISTSSSPETCGTSLELNKIYLIKGHLSEEATISMCGTYRKILPQVPTTEEAKTLFSDLYKSNC